MGFQEQKDAIWIHDPDAPADVILSAFTFIQFEVPPATRKSLLRGAGGRVVDAIRQCHSVHSESPAASATLQDSSEVVKGGSDCC